MLSKHVRRIENKELELVLEFEPELAGLVLPFPLVGDLLLLWLGDSRTMVLFKQLAGYSFVMVQLANPLGLVGREKKFQVAKNKKTLELSSSH